MKPEEIKQVADQVRECHERNYALTRELERWKEYADKLRSEVLKLHEDLAPLNTPYFRCGDHMTVGQINDRGYQRTECGECARVAVTPFRPRHKDEDVEQLDPGEDRREQQG